MNRKISVLLLVIVVALLASSIGGVVGSATTQGMFAGSQPIPKLATSPLVPVGNGFTYQGSLLQNNNPANGQFGMTFSLYDALSGGSQISSTIALTQTVENGFFTVSLDFGNTAFLGEARWLEMAVRPVGGSYNTLTPRQPLTPAPYAQSAPWFGISGKPDGYNPLRADNLITTIDGIGNVGEYTSITIGADGLPLLSYYDETGLQLKVVHCGDLQCSSGNTITILDTDGDVGWFTSVTIGRDGLGLISYYANSGSDLRVAHCDNVACTSATKTTLDANGDVGLYTSVTIGADGNGVISYRDNTRGSLKVAHCNNVPCTSATTTTVDDNGDNGLLGTSVVIGSDGLPLISYYEQSIGNLKMVHCGDLVCGNGNNITTFDTPGMADGSYNSLTIGSDGLGLISYYDASNYRLIVTHCNNTPCTAGNTSSIESGGINTGSYTSTSVGANGLAMISYWHSPGLRIAHCSTLECDRSVITLVDNNGTVGLHTGITRGVDGLPLISYFDLTNHDFKVAHCGNPLCVPFQHSR